MIDYPLPSIPIVVLIAFIFSLFEYWRFAEAVSLRGVIYKSAWLMISSVAVVEMIINHQIVTGLLLLTSFILLGLAKEDGESYVR